MSWIRCVFFFICALEVVDLELDVSAYIDVIMAKGGKNQHILIFNGYRFEWNAVCQRDLINLNLFIENKNKYCELRFVLGGLGW